MDKKVVVITGASSGIGASTALVLSGQGHSVTLVARRMEALAAVAERCANETQVIVADVERRPDVKRVVEQALEKWRRVDVWVNNAGHGITRPPTELTDDDIDEMIRANVKSALYGMQEILPHFKSRNEGQIINISSLLGRVPFATVRSAYSGAKHFLNALTAMVREEVQETHPGIQLTLVSPGTVSTDFGLNALHGGPDSRTLHDPQTPEQVAGVIARAIESREPDVYTRPGSQARIASYYASVGVDP